MSVIKSLDAVEATIKTATVEVKVLTISGKQVTLAVFRQLPQETLIDLESDTLNGVVWGTVNYHWDKCWEHGTHLHVVWQNGTKLCRDMVFARMPDKDDWLHSLTAYQQKRDDLALAYLLLRRILQKSPLVGSGVLQCSIDIGQVPSFVISLQGNGYALSCPETSLQYTLRDIRSRINTAVTKFGIFVDTESDEAFLASVSDATLAEFTNLLRNHANDYLEELSDFRDHERQYRDLYVQLSALDQLFIAV